MHDSAVPSGRLGCLAERPNCPGKQLPRAIVIWLYESNCGGRIRGKFAGFDDQTARHDITAHDSHAQHNPPSDISIPTKLLSHSLE